MASASLVFSVRLQRLSHARYLDHNSLRHCIGATPSTLLGQPQHPLAYNPLTKCSVNLIRLSHSSQAQSRPNIARNKSKLKSYMELMRLDKPTGTYLALTPALWSVAMATPITQSLPNGQIVGIFVAGAIIARGMGCTVNDILDRNLDKHVERTKTRPIASGEISVREAVWFLGAQSLAGLFVLCLNNIEVIKLGLLSGLMISSYPLFKRFTYWPQAMLALTINWGVPMGWAAVHGGIDQNGLAVVLPIYLGALCWTLYYDTIYAEMDKSDDKKVGIKSTALRFDRHSKTFLHSALAGMFGSLVAAGYTGLNHELYYFGLLLVYFDMNRRTLRLNLNDRDQCMKEFNFQKWFGMALFAIIAMTKVVEHEKFVVEMERHDKEEQGEQLKLE